LYMVASPPYFIHQKNMDGCYHYLNLKLTSTIFQLTRVVYNKNKITGKDALKNKKWMKKR
ncbi:MAG: hypothetical protein ACQXXF_07495, partial [Thermoplasmatota archaeon]